MRASPPVNRIRTGAYTDVVFGLFTLLGYQFSPRIADIGGTRYWRIDASADYGCLNGFARHRVIQISSMTTGTTRFAWPVP